jgi:thioredoxin reductase (NADPH)
MNKLYDLVVIGGGPGGIGAVVEAKVLGLKNVLLIEKSKNHSHTIRKFYKDKKRVDKDWRGQSVELEGNVEFVDGTKESTLDYFDKLLDDESIDSRFNCEVSKVKKKSDIFYISTPNGNFKAKNVIVSIGRMGKPNRPNYKIPASIRGEVNYNLDKCGNGENIIVVGGGDSAVEYACELSDSNSVVLNYRKEVLSRPNPTNQKIIKDYASHGKVKLKLGVDIESVEAQHGKVKINFFNGDKELYDRAIYAIGGTTPKDFLKSCGITLDERGEPIFNPRNYESEQKGLYIAGDIAFASGGSIAIALNHGYRIVTDILSKG